MCLVHVLNEESVVLDDINEHMNQYKKFALNTEKENFKNTNNIFVFLYMQEVLF